MKTRNYVKNGTSDSLPIPFILVVFAFLGTGIAVNLLCAGQSWLVQFNRICWIGGPMTIIGVLLLYLFNPTVRKLLTRNTISAQPLSAGFQSIGKKRVPQSAVRPEVYGESCNARVSSKSTTDQLQIVPLWFGHAVTAVLGVFIGIVLILTATIKSVNPDHPEFSALLPNNAILQVFASIPPGFKFFIGLFGLIGLAIILNTQRKPMRRVVFDRKKNSCTISRLWLFGKISRPLDHIDLADVGALQVTSYTDKQAATQYTVQTGKRGWSPKHATREYELNLVMNDGSRVNLVNHRYKKGVLRVTTRLHDWLGTPVLGQI